MAKAIKVENLSKAYQLGEIGTGTLAWDLERWFAKIRGKEDPFVKIGETNSNPYTSNNEIFWSLKDINFEIKEGEVVGIIGSNGAGKSTLLKILSRVTSPTTGKIKVKGRIASLLEVGTGFHAELTGRENIFLNGAILGMRKIEIKKKFDEIVDFAGVERYIDTPVKRYSSGMYVRLAFSVAAFLEPEILIIDEVLAVGDAEFQNKCLGRMKDISLNEGRTILFVSHNMISIKSLCNSSMLLRNGNLVYQGSTENAIDKYNNQRTIKKSFNLSERLDRAGNKQLKLMECKINNNADESEIKSTERIVFNIEYESQLEKFIGKIFIGVYDSMGTPIFFLDSDSIKGIPNYFPGRGEIKIKLGNDFALFKGRYTINIAFFVNGDMADYVQNALSFNIIDDDFLGSGKLPSSQYTIIPKQTWIINSNEIICK